MFSDTVLVGSPEPYGPDFDRMGARVKQAGVQRGLATLVCEGPLAPFGDELKVILRRNSRGNRGFDFQR